MKFRIREMAPGYRLEVAVPAFISFPPEYVEAKEMKTVVLTWIPVGHPCGSIESCKAVALQHAKAGVVIEEFDV